VLALLLAREAAAHACSLCQGRSRGPAHWPPLVQLPAARLQLGCVWRLVYACRGTSPLPPPTPTPAPLLRAHTVTICSSARPGCRPRPPPTHPRPPAALQVPYDVPAFVRDVGDGILPSWAGIAGRRRRLPVSQEQRDWQLLRRGRWGPEASGG
jgi:hypothetical protein